MERTVIRLTSWLATVPALAVGLLLGPAGRVQAGPLNPPDFASLGAFPTAAGTYTFDTSGTPTLTGPNGNVIETGVIYNGIAVFDFNSINVTASQVFDGGSGPLPLALLSRSNASIAAGGTIDVSGGNAFTGGPPPLPGGPGGGTGGMIFGVTGGGPGAGPGGGGGGQSMNDQNSGGGGGGFGGLGSAGAGAPPLTGVGPVVAGGAGGSAYGNPGLQLQGGSGGGGSLYGIGGGGGGAIELGAVGTINVRGEILAYGGDGEGAGGGGGSGGPSFCTARP